MRFQFLQLCSLFVDHRQFGPQKVSHFCTGISMLMLKVEQLTSFLQRKAESFCALHKSESFDHVL